MLMERNPLLYWHREDMSQSGSLFFDSSLIYINWVLPPKCFGFTLFGEKRFGPPFHSFETDSWCSLGVRKAVSLRNVLTHYRDSRSTKVDNNWITAHSFQVLLTLWKSWHISLINSYSHCISVGSSNSFRPVLLGKIVMRKNNTF